MVSQTFGWSLFCCYCCRQGRVEGKMESDQISICYLNSLFKVNMDFYHIKPKLMSQRFCAWILLANRKIILRDGRLKELFLRRTWGTGCCKSSGQPVGAPRRPTSALDMGVVLCMWGLSPPPAALSPSTCALLSLCFRCADSLSRRST